MDSLVDWLNGREGNELVHAVILALTAVAAYLAWQTRGKKNGPPPE